MIEQGSTYAINIAVFIQLPFYSQCRQCLSNSYFCLAWSVPVVSRVETSWWDFIEYMIYYYRINVINKDAALCIDVAYIA